uniref:Kelch-like protein 12 n=1 Tax=Phallusia mammillata TaxID=59560 RepID=A0A6F9DFF2_9ASCI|nr:kelch-like protein 12 [Phallusia mammillata]
MLKSLEQAAIECIHKHFDEVCMSEKFLDLSENEVRCFYESDELNVEVEDVLFTALVNWTNHNLQARQESFLGLFSLIRLQFVTKVFLTNIIRKEKLVRDNMNCRDLVEDVLHFQIKPDTLEKQKPRSNNVYKKWFLLTPNSTVKTLQLKEDSSCDDVQTPLHVSYQSAIVLHENKVVFCGGLSLTHNKATTSIVSFDGEVWKGEGNKKMWSLITVNHTLPNKLLINLPLALDYHQLKELKCLALDLQHNQLQKQK